MIHAVKTSARGIILYGTVGFVIGFVVAFGFRPCGAGQEPPFQAQVNVTLQFAGAFAALGFLMGFFSALLFDRRRQL